MLKGALRHGGLFHYKAIISDGMSYRPGLFLTVLPNGLARIQAKAVIVQEVERLRWRMRNGKAKNAKRSIDRVRKVMHVYKEENAAIT
jgi:hypothetical protein